MLLEPAGDFRIETKMDGHIGPIEPSPRSLIRPKLDTIAEQAVVVRDTAFKEQTKSR